MKGGGKMALNLSKTKCHFCYEDIKITGPIHSPTLEDVKKEENLREPYLIHTYVAEAECSLCGAKYTSWHRIEHDRSVITDLSFRSTFRDEPGPSDLPCMAKRKLFTKIRRFKQKKVQTEIEEVIQHIRNAFIAYAK